MASERAKFAFRSLPNKKFSFFENKENQERLLKWSMKDRILIQGFLFDKQFKEYEKDEFVLDFFKDPEVTSSLKSLSSSGKWSPIGIEAKSVKVETIPVTVISMDFFDKLYKGVAKESGALCKCLDEYIDEFIASDELRKMMLSEESDYYDIFDESEKSELLFRLFRHLCIGGQVCQYEDELQPYLDITKGLYKDLVSVVKDSNSNKLKVQSIAFKVTAFEKDGAIYFPSTKNHMQDFAYLIIDPLKRHVNVIQHVFGASAF
ncbi:DgyrCDS5522 [Dimorphilus gyrociliatus]|uniref:Cilia- and flagella-associated protein 300 n=1 Tax=Dimorphilus gyrociliatus TaxID=2664684 RepID=A0A7I8VKT2_9ANNE|nr:DgyrCDS5522 [Dimorphilus gyrociliatus]